MKKLIVALAVGFVILAGSTAGYALPQVGAQTHKDGVEKGKGGKKGTDKAKASPGATEKEKKGGQTATPKSR
ncbi:MAG: hypothetical protein QM757_18240 [Paludibaculum sp.]